LNAVRSELYSGRRAPGERLQIDQIARQLTISSTPVREALAYLAGQGLIVERRGAGYFTWALDAHELVELYDLHLILLRAVGFGGGRETKSLAPIPSLEGASPVEEHLRRTERVFGSHMALAWNGGLRSAHALLAERLAPVRRVEFQVFDGLDEELAELERAMGAGRRGTVLRLAKAYHRRRSGRAIDLVRAWRGAGRNLGAGPARRL
jgi:hypothetical protein